MNKGQWLAFFILMIGFFQPANASPTVIQKINNWIVYSDSSGSDTICYAATQATDKAPKATEHGDIWFHVANWKSGKARNQPSLKVGYELRDDLPGKAVIGKRSWSLFGIGQQAYAENQNDAALVQALTQGRELRVETISARNTRVSYHFSLSGSAAAIDKAAALCR